MSEQLPNPTWDELFMRHVYLIASKSKDPRTRIGAVLVREKRIISEGYNGICQGVVDNLPDRSERPEKYFFYEHAERNSVYGCAKFGISTQGTTLYTPGIPCYDCARAVIQAGIVEIKLHSQWAEYEKQIYREKWEEGFKRSYQMLKEAGVKVDYVNSVLGMKGMLDGKVIDV
jgi:dCMP deaminase